MHLQNSLNSNTYKLFLSRDCAPKERRVWNLKCQVYYPKKKLVNGMMSTVRNYCITFLIHNNDQYKNNSGYTL